MPLSTSNFEPDTKLRRTLTRGTWLLFALTALYLAGMEYLSAVVFNRVSHIQSRVLRDLDEAKRMRPSAPREPATALFLGNSLLLDGVDTTRLKDGLAPRVRATVLPVEASNFYDLYYLLQRLLREGARPRYVMLCMGTSSLVSPAIRGDYSAHYLVDSLGLRNYIRNSSLHPTEKASLWLAHFSAFYGSRQEIRGFFQFRVFPYFEQMAGPSIIRAQSVPTDADVWRVGEPRFHALRALADEFGFQLIYVIMPCRQPGEDVTQQLGQKASVPVLLPIRNFELSKEMYRDTIHLNAKGAAVLTDALIKSVDQFVASQNPPQQK